MRAIDLKQILANVPDDAIIDSAGLDHIQFSMKYSETWTAIPQGPYYRDTTILVTISTLASELEGISIRTIERKQR